MIAYKVIRDSVTGRFASRATFNRSVSHGGTRYKEQVITKGDTGGIGEPPFDEEEWIEWAVTWQYPGD